jgi:hypothetical protein
MILALGLLVRLGWGLSRPTDDTAIDLLPDQRGYLELAQNLLRGEGLHFVDHRFGLIVDGKPVGQTVYATRTPGYPAFIALCGGSIRAVRVVQSFVDVSTAFAVFLLTRRLLQSDCAATWAAGFVAFNPFLVYFSGLLLTETLYTAMLAWGMLLLVGRGWIGGIAMLALAIHVRPAGIALPVVLAIGATYLRLPLPSGEGWGEGASEGKPRNFDRHTPSPQPSPEGRGSRKSLVLAAVFGLALTIAVLLPWAYRNDRVLDRWIWSTSNDGITAYDGFNPDATGASEQKRFVERIPAVATMAEMERSDYFAGEARRFIRENPERLAGLTLAKTARTWSPVPLSAEFGRPLYRVVAALFAVPFYLLVLLGIFRGHLLRRMKVFLLLPALYFTAIHAMSVGSLRYRVPAEPPLAVLAAAGAVRAFGAKSGPRLASEPAK